MNSFYGKSLRFPKDRKEYLEWIVKILKPVVLKIV